MANRNQRDQPQNNLIRSIFSEQQQKTSDFVILIPNHLTLTIFDHGHGLYPQTGMFIRYKQISYLQKQMQLLKQQIIEIPIQRGKLIPALQIALSFLKQGSRIRLWTSSILAYGDSFNQNIPIDSSLVFDIQVYSISKIPSHLNTNNELLIFFQQILKQSHQGDEWMKKGKFQQSLKAYENAVSKILSVNIPQKRPTVSISNSNSLEKQYNQESQKLLPASQSHSLDIVKILLKFQNTCCKYLELCFSVGQYLKIISSSFKIMKKLNIDINNRIINVLVLTYIELDEIQMAQKYLDRIKDQKDSKQQMIQKLDKQIRKYKQTQIKKQ